jgi:DNA-binding GntR family transcriptional regulator
MTETATLPRAGKADAPRLDATPLQTRSLREQVYDYLRAEMARGGLQPGGFIDLNELAARLGVSRTPLREALLHLESQGFVTVLPRRGFRLNALTLDDIRHFYEIVGALEAAALRAAGPSLGPADFARMRALDAAMAEAVTSRSTTSTSAAARTRASSRRSTS